MSRSCQDRDCMQGALRAVSLLSGELASAGECLLERQLLFAGISENYILTEHRARFLSLETYFMGLLLSLVK